MTDYLATSQMMADFDELDICRRALKRALPWLRLIASEQGRPKNSDIHAVVKQAERALGAVAESHAPNRSQPND